ncbi:RHS repeat-associated core domain-containing protein [bacterium]|nr:RHS repeat-associated core domain-containing protein [bacterium]
MFADTGATPNGVADMLEYNSYYAFGMRIEGTGLSSSSIDNKFTYNGKELEDDHRLNWYHYGARFYDPQVGRWHVVDPLDEFHSPYIYVGNNPIAFLDPDGAGEMYFDDGTYIGNDGVDDDKVWMIAGTEAIEMSVSHTELMLLAATSYGESSTANVSKEVYSIASAIINNMSARGSSATITSTIDGFAFAASDGNPRVQEFNGTSMENRNGKFMQTAVAGALNAVNGGVDYSNGATHWAGDDIGSSAEKRATGGLLFSNAAHDLFGLGSSSKSGTGYWYDASGKVTGTRGTWNYTWETTAAFGGTVNGNTTGSTFMRKTNDFIKATGAPRY